MSERVWTDSNLDAYLDESLSAADMTALEAALRAQPKLLERLSVIIARRDAGVHTLGEIWRRQRASCASREQLGSYLLGVLDDETASYIRFHLDKIGCRYCEANLEDLRTRQEETAEAAGRRRRYFQSSAGYLRRSRDD